MRRTRSSDEPFVLRFGSLHRAQISLTRSSLCVRRTHRRDREEEPILGLECFEPSVNGIGEGSVFSLVTNLYQKYLGKEGHRLVFSQANRPLVTSTQVGSVLSYFMFPK
jgi:hypothetical protein